MARRTKSSLRTVAGWVTCGAAALGTWSCGPGRTEALVATPPAPEPEPVVEVLPAQPEVPEDPLPPPQAREPRTWAETTFEQLTLREKVGQLIMPWVLGDYAPEGSPSHERVAEYVHNQGIGGVIMSVGTPLEVAAKLNDLQGHARIPLLVGADLETGAGFRMRGAMYMPGSIDLGGATQFPSLMAVGASGDERLAYEMGRVTALEARAVGIHIPFAPVLDVNNNPANPIINVRSFGESPVDVSRMGIAFIRGIQENGAIATGKHFPGHGDTDIDSHLALPVILHDRARMDSIELRPFKEAIDAGMGAIMTAHIAVPSLTGGVSQPSTLSSMVLTTILREEMGFDGLIFTDAMDMSAIARQHSAGEAAVRAIEAGADVILMPPDVAAAIEGIVDAVHVGRLPEERVNASVMRVLQAKEALGLPSARFTPLDRVGSIVGIPEHGAVADEIAERSITLLKNDRNLLPLRGTRSASVLSVSFRRQSDVLAARSFNRVMRETYPRLSTVDVESDADEATYANVLRRVRGQNLVIISTYSSYAGAVDALEDLATFIEQVRRTGVPHVVISFGNPYLISSFPDVQAYMLAWNGSDSSQRAAARALLGGFAIEGRVPTSIPPLFTLGDGLSVPMKTQTGVDR